MRERINRLAKGIIDTELPRVAAAPVSIDDTVRPQTEEKKEFYVGSLNGLNVKGLVYSSNLRVRVPVNAFGGLRNHIAYGVDTACLPAGAEIRGEFDLVTNAGEYKIPYVFRGELSTSARAIGELKSAAGFAKLAMEDAAAAVRLMEFEDFVDAPFMQDLRTRAIYDTLKGHGSRRNCLEEFLVALGQKNPVTVTLEGAERKYERLTVMAEDEVVIRRSGWGYIYMETAADGDFIQLDKRCITQDDFEGDVCRFTYRIRPERLHGGRNFGAIRLKSAREEFTVRLEACGGGVPESVRTAMAAYREHFRNYFSLRLSCEENGGDEAALQRMQREADALCRLAPSQPVFFLLQAELALFMGKRDRAAAILENVREAVYTERERERGNYCFFQYLSVTLSGDAVQRDALIRLLKRYAEEDEAGFYMFYLLMKVDRSLTENPGTLFGALRRRYGRGAKSPLLFIEGCRLMGREPELLRNLGAFELHCLHYGVRHGLALKETALAAARLSAGVKGFHRLHFSVLTELYGRFQEPEILAAVCALLIKNNLRQPKYFVWYERAVEAKISLTRLYEYFLYSLPEDYGRALPREVLLYFTYDRQLDKRSRSVLYENILLYLKREDPLYGEYERDMEQFAMEQLLEGRMNGRLAVIYRRLIYKEMIDGQAALKLPAVLSAHRIRCGCGACGYVVVSYEELDREDAYPLRDGEAYVPVFSERAIIEFQDSFGNRYLNVPFESEPVMDEPELLKRCREVSPDHEMLRLMALTAAGEKERPDEEDISLMEHAMEEMSLRPLYRRKLLGKVIGCYERRISEREEGEYRGTDTSYLLCLDKRELDAAERKGICETLISQNYCSEAYDMIRDYRLEGVKPELLAKLCGRMILQNLFDQDELLLHLSMDVFSQGLADSVILDYLCEHFNGTVGQMYRVLNEAVGQHVETYDLEERLLAQMMFTGNTELLDRVFSLYVSRKKTSESIVKAYFTVKCADYFLREQEVDGEVFTYLERAVENSAEKNRVPDIYLMALTKYYASLPALDGGRAGLCRELVEILLEEGMVFAYFKDLAAYADIPGDIMDREIIEYHGLRDQKPVLKVRILPGAEEFSAEEMRQVYKGIYVEEKVLFEGEVMEYRIYEEPAGGGEPVLKKEGSVACRRGKEEQTASSRFDCLNQMSLSLEQGDEESLKREMTEYVILDAAVRTMFPLS